jgi:hypothetical protein
MHDCNIVQVPGEVLTLQLAHGASHAVSQQTPSAAHTPLAHSCVEAQAVPGVFRVWQMPFTSQ